MKYDNGTSTEGALGYGGLEGHPPKTLLFFPKKMAAFKASN
jgi:hypothetical protein